MPTASDNVRHRAHMSRTSTRVHRQVTVSADIPRNTAIAPPAGSATALGHIAAHEAGITSGIVSTFHEFGASLGAAVISSVAAASLAGTTTRGFQAGFTLACVAAVVAGLL